MVGVGKVVQATTIILQSHRLIFIKKVTRWWKISWNSCHQGSSL